LTGLANQNVLMNATNSLDQNKMNVLNNIINNQSIRTLSNFPTNAPIRSASGMASLNGLNPNVYQINNFLNNKFNNAQQRRQQQQQANLVTTHLNMMNKSNMTGQVGSGNVTVGGRNQTNQKPSIANTTNIETFLVANENDIKPVAPSEAIQDKIGFIIIKYANKR